MKRYQCHKVVEAGKIKSIVTHPAMNGNKQVVDITFHDGSNVRVDLDYVRDHHPKPNGYFVRYKDGYISYSPAKAFEEGYKCIGEAFWSKES